MNYITTSNLKNNFNNICMSCIKYDEVFTITSKNGNVVLLNENNYNNMIESLKLLRNSETRKSILEAIDTPTDELIHSTPWERN